MIDQVFVFGNSRSGTTLVSQVLGKNDDVYTFHEIHFFEQLWSSNDADKILTYEEAVKLADTLLRIERKGYLQDLKKISFFDEAKKFVENINEKDLTKINVYKYYLQYETLRNNKLIPCEQTPRNQFFIKEIMNGFENSRCICMMRDPEDVLLSQKNKWRLRKLGATSIPWKETLRTWTNYHPITISLLWRASSRIAIKYKDSQQVKLVKFEDFISDPQKVTEKICDFINIKYNDSMLAVPTFASSHKEKNTTKLGIDNESKERWKKGGLTDEEIWICEMINKNGMEYGDYQKSSISPNYIKLFIVLVSFFVKTPLVFILNAKRSANLLESIVRRFKV